MKVSGEKLLLLSFLCFFFFATDVFAFEYPRYDITANIDVKNKKLTAAETVVFTNNTQESVGEVYFHIYPNRKFTEKEKNFMMRYGGYFKVNPFPGGFKQGKVDIQSVVSGRDTLSFTVEGEDQTILRVPLTKKLTPGESIEMKINFSLDIPHAYGRLGWNQDVIALAKWYPVLSVLNENGWNNHLFYPFHRPFFSDAAHYAVHVTVPQDEVVIHSGLLSDETRNDDRTKTLHIKTSAPVRDFSLALSSGYKIIQEEADGVTIKVFYLNNNEAHARKALQDVKDVFAFYGRQFGAYPYEEFNIAPVYLGYGGEQMSNMAFIDTRVFELPKILDRYFDFLISHETGHQWFYNVVGTDGFSEMWLEEGVNSYFNLQYLENKYGKNAGIVELPKALNWLLPNVSFRRGRDFRYKLIARTTMDKPVKGKLSSFTEPSSIFSITYGKGSAIVSMLRSLIGDEAFGRVFTRIFKEYRFKNLSMQDFVKVCEEESRLDLKEFFDQWLQTADKLDAAVGRVQGRAVTLQNRGAVAMPVVVETEFKDGTKETSVWDMKEKTKIFETQRNVPIKKVTLDPKEELLDIDRTNNSYPRTVHIKPVPLYLPLYDMPLFLKEDGYNVVFGPEIANGGLGIKASAQKPYDQIVYAATDYDFNDQLLKSRTGYRLHNVFNSFKTLGFEFFNTTDFDGGEEDLAGGKVYLRQELWPASYGLTDINDHITYYLLRDQSLNKDLSSSGIEDSRNTSYLRKNEAIIGSVLHLGRAGTYPDPSEGYKIDALLESSNHMLGATQYFYRGSLDWAGYKPVTAKTTAALRLKYGWGYPLDKNLYEIGGFDGLRGYDRKTIRGARALLGSLEYRFPLVENRRWQFFGNLLGVEALGAAVFFDAGQSWYNRFDDARLKKDAGGGLRATVTVGSFLEKAVVRMDIAEPIDDSTEDTHFWFGVGQAF